MNTFGKIFKFTSFGESHGKAVGCVIEGVPAGLKIDESAIQSELDRRKPGKNKFTTPRREDDKTEILSGVFEGVATGAPIAAVIYNANQRSKDYEDIKDLFRPSHADFTYYAKYGVRDHRGGGRSSARESAARVVAGALAKQALAQAGVQVLSGVYSIGALECQKIDFAHAAKSPIYSLDESAQEAQMRLLEDVKSAGDSIGGSVIVRVLNAPAGLGEPLFGKLDGDLAAALMGVNAVKAVEIGLGARSSLMRGSEYNDQMANGGFLSNNSGGILGGISTGEPIDLKVYFKPTPSISIAQKTINKQGADATIKIFGRHDPCVAVRGSVVCEAMTACVILDKMLLHLHSRLDNFLEVFKPSAKA